LRLKISLLLLPEKLYLLGRIFIRLAPFHSLGEQVLEEAAISTFLF